MRSTVNRLIGAAETASAIAVHLGVVSGTAVVPGELAARARAVSELALGDLSGLTAQQLTLLAALTRGQLAQAAAVASQPDHPESWAVTDPAVLRAQGQASAVFAHYICATLSAQMPGLGDLLARPGARVLDVGVGVAALSMAFARELPDAHVVGIDVWEPSLEIARAETVAAGLADRVELRQQDVCELPDRSVFSLVWFSGPFVPAALQPIGLARCSESLVSGGWLVYGAFGGRDAMTAALADLRTVRSGGPVLSDDEVAAMLTVAGLVDVHATVVDVTLPSRVIVGRRP